MARLNTGLKLWRDSCSYFFNRYQGLLIMPGQKSDSMKPTQVETVNTHRRKLTSAALAGPVVLGTLASKKALGAVPYNCTVSGQISNNESPGGPGSGVCGNLGLSPGCWKQSKDNNKVLWPASAPARDATFSEVFGVDFHGATLIQVLCVESYGNTNVYNIVNPIRNGAPNADLARAGVASLLNAHKVGALSSHDYYGVTVGEVIELVRNALGGSDLISNQTGGRVSTIEFLTSLYGGSASNVDGGNTVDCPHDTNITLAPAQICTNEVYVAPLPEPPAPPPGDKTKSNNNKKH